MENMIHSCCGSAQVRFLNTHGKHEKIMGNKKIKYRLGLDLGTNSLGWAIIGLDGKNEPNRIVDAGVRIFADGRDSKTKATLKADRRDARSMRRRRDRYLQRRKWLLVSLEKHGLFPSSPTAQKALQSLDPWELRAKALTHRLDPHHIGRALFHLNQRRGFKSNRKDTKDSEAGLVKESVHALKEKMSGKTLGQFLHERNKQNHPVRARRKGTKQTDLYDFYPERAMLEDEFHRIWKAQATHHPELLTEDLRQHFHKIIFSQRRLKPPSIGFCAYMPVEQRMARALPSFQRYRIYQEINNLAWHTDSETHRLIDHKDTRDAIFKLLEKPKNKAGTVTFKQIRKVLKNSEVMDGNYDFNLESDRRPKLDGNKTSNIMQSPDRIGEQWHEWSLEKQDEFVSIILDPELEDEQAAQELQTQYELNEETAYACVNAPLEDGYASLSRAAASLLLEKMETEYCIQPDAIDMVSEQVDGFSNPYQGARKGGEPLAQLPYYGSAIQGHIVPGTGDPKDPEEKRVGSITNPTVHIALNQIRRVLNELLRRYGHPTSIAVELSRDLPMGQEQLSDLKREYKENQDTNDRHAKKLREHGKAVNRENILRLRLWEELGDDPIDRRCPFSGKKISITSLFNGDAEIEHLIPFSISLDDSRANKVICTREANRSKGNQTPHEAFGNSPDGYDWAAIFDRSRSLPKSKQWRFLPEAKDIWKRDHQDFLARHLNDTRYISRLTREYLENICPRNKIDVLTGRHTAMLRNSWGLNNILFEGQEKKKKNRDDHRHHAVDAITAGLSTLSLLQEIASRAEELETQGSDVFEFDKDIQLWDGFRKEAKETVASILVSHKKHSSAQGKLHNETAYGVPELNENPEPDFSKTVETVVRKPIETFVKRSDIEKIRKSRLREHLLGVFDELGKDGVLKYAEHKGIRRIKIVEKLSVIPIRGTDGKTYKAYKGDSNWAAEIYKIPGKEKWEDCVISRFEANQKGFRPGFTKRPHPAATLVMRLMQNDCVEIHENGNNKIMRVQKISKGKYTLSPLYEANTDARNRDKQDPFLYASKSANALRKLQAKKVHISPSGMLSRGKP